MTGVASNRIANPLNLEHIFKVARISLLLNPMQKVLQVCKGVGVEECEEDSIFLMVEFVLETECVERDHLGLLVFEAPAGNGLGVELIIRGTLSVLSPQLVLEVAHIVPSSFPLPAWIFQVVLERVHEGLHTDLEARLVFLEVDEVELEVAESDVLD
jgi:hypothetical protein